MTDIMKLADAYALCNRAEANVIEQGNDKELLEAVEDTKFARAALQAALEAQAAEIEQWKVDFNEMKIDHDELAAEIERLAHANNALKLAVSGLQAKLTAMEAQEKWSVRKFDDLAEVLNERGEKIATLYAAEAKHIVDAHNAYSTRQPLTVEADALRLAVAAAQQSYLDPDEPEGNWCLIERCHVEALCAAATKLYASPVVQQAWQPIETAPTDGTFFLGLRDRKVRETYRVQRDDCEMWCFGGSSGAVEFAPYLKPTHWMPLPAAPAIGGQQP